MSSPSPSQRSGPTSCSSAVASNSSSTVSIAAPMHSIVQVFQFLFERFSSVGLPCHAINSGRSVSREREVAPL